jgi:hypothetical protein
VKIRHPHGHEQPCERCGYPYGMLVRYVIRSGATQVRYRCAGCEHIQGFSIPREQTGDPEQYPVARDSSGEVSCAVRGCERRGAELHHFAPKHIFGAAEAERWPLVYLCLEHHGGWHRRMNAAMRLTLKRSA